MIHERLFLVIDFDKNRVFNIANVNVNLTLLCDDKGVTIAMRYILPHVQHRKSSSASLHRFRVFYSARRVRSFSIRRRFPVLDPTLKLFQTYRNRESRRRIFAAYVRTYVCAVGSFTAACTSFEVAAASFLPTLFQGEITPFQFLMPP